MFLCVSNRSNLSSADREKALCKITEPRKENLNVVILSDINLNCHD